MKKNGFIATSLIYSFFLVFIAIIAALLNNYIANKTIVDRFNGDVQNTLNSKTYTVTLYSRNANIQDGMTLSNLISNGNFQTLDFWNTEGSATFTPTAKFNSFALLKNNVNTNNSYVYQNIHVLENSIYYFSIDYSHSNDTVLNTYIDTAESGVIGTRNNLGNTWTRDSQTYKSTSDTYLKFIVGNSSFNYTGMSHFTNALVMNLTASFGSGYEPDKSWIDSNIEWFDGTISYIRKDGIESGSALEVRFSPYMNSTDHTISCSSDSSNPMARSNRTNIRYETVNGRVYGIFRIESVESNMSCNVDWSV